MSVLDLLNILEYLKPDEFEKFKWALKYEKVGDIPPIKEYQLSKAERQDVVDLMVQKYEFAGAVEVMKNILKERSRNDLVTELSTIASGGKDQEKVLHSNALPTRKHLSVSQTNLPQISEPIDQSSTKHSQAVKETIEIMEKTSLTHKELQVLEKQFKLVEDEFRRAHHPKVKILRGVNSVILEGPDKEVQLADTKLEELIKQLKEKRVKLSAALITFMTSSGVISKYQTRFQRSLRSPVALEVGSDLVLSSLSSAALDEAETAVLRDLSEVTVQLQGSTASSPHLDKVKEILIKAKNEANLQELRVEVSFVPDPRAAVIKVQLVGYTEHVNKLKDLLLEYQIKHLKNLHPQRDEVQKNISDKNRQSGGAGGMPLYYRTTQDSYTEKRKISIVVLGTEDDLKISLISLILGRDVFAQRSCDVINEKYENDTYVVTTSNLAEAKEKIRFSSEQPDMRLLVVEDGFKTQEVWQQIEKLHEITGKPSEEFTVVLPLGCKHEESYPFKFYTWDYLFKSLKSMPEKNKKRPAEQPQTPMETDKPPSLLGKAWNPLSWFSTDNKKSLKENQSNNKVNLVLLGRYGSGKSASGNTILGKRQFESKPSSMPITTECQAAETEINGTRVRVIDTPDMFDDGIKPSDKNQHVTMCKQLICQSDPCVYLLVIQVDRFTDGERDILRKVEAAFGRRAKEQTIILFTRGEDLQRKKMSLQDFLHSCQPELKNIVKQCGGRCVVFENKTSRQPQVAELMQTVNMMLDKQQKQ